MIEILIAILSSITTVCVVFLKFHLERKKDDRIKNEIWGIILQQGVQSVKLNIKTNKKEQFNFESKGNQLNEYFFPTDRFGVGITSRRRLGEEDQKAINDCISHLDNKI